MYIDYTEEKKEAVELLKKQLKVEGELIGLYEALERESSNKALKRIVQMYRFDSQRHINILQAAIEVIQGEEVFIEDKKPLSETLRKHIELEKEALYNANRLMGKTWVEENKGLKGLLQIWRDDEKRHHSVLKELTSKPYFQLGTNDMVALFREEEFLEERYRKSKAFKAKHE